MTDLASVLQGGMGMAAGGNIGDEHAMFEPIHGSAPKYVGQNKVNPVATILSVKMMLEWLGERFEDAKMVDAGAAIEQAVVETLRANVKTYDLGGKNSCSQVGEAVAKALLKPKAAAKARAR